MNSIKVILFIMLAFSALTSNTSLRAASEKVELTDVSAETIVSSAQEEVFENSLEENEEGIVTHVSNNNSVIEYLINTPYKKSILFVFLEDFIPPKA